MLNLYDHTMTVETLLCRIRSGGVDFDSCSKVSTIQFLCCRGMNCCLMSGQVRERIERT
jgi:hypothetical protein